MTTPKQMSLFPGLCEEVQTPKAVNVASVPQRSPFRYPGGKTWFVPTFRQWIKHINYRPMILVEPFVGGGIISLTALFENLVERVVMVELDDEIAAVWQCVVDGNATWLAKRIQDFDVTEEGVLRELERKPTTTREKAFQTILKNRTLHGGILAEGSRFIKYGENGKGISSRWYPETLAKRLLNLNLVAGRIDFRCGDAFEAIMEFSSTQGAVFFIDPPYTAGGKKAGKRLYRHYDVDHDSLFELCASIKGDFLMTYDHAEEVKQMARRHRFEMRLIPMTNTHHATMSELVIGRDLSWMDGLPAVHEPQAQYGRKSGKRKRPQQKAGGTR